MISSTFIIMFLLLAIPFFVYLTIYNIADKELKKTSLNILIYGFASLLYIVLWNLIWKSNISMEIKNIFFWFYFSILFFAVSILFTFFSKIFNVKINFIAKKWLISLVPTLILLILFTIELVYKQISYNKNYSEPIFQNNYYYSKIPHVLLFIQIIIYTIPFIIKYRNNNLSNPFYFKLFTITNVISIAIISEQIFINKLTYFNGGLSIIIVFLYNTFICLWFINYLKTNYAKLKNKNVETKIYFNKKTNNNKKLPLNKIDKIINDVNCEIKNNKHFLKQNYSLSDLEKEMKINRIYLSKAMNYYGITFNDLINHCRIKEAKILLENKQNLTIEHIAYSVGYKSKTTFNTHFKKILGLTPKEYIRTMN